MAAVSQLNTRAPQYEEGDRIVGAVLSFRDISQRKLVEEALRESEERHRALVEESVEAIYVFEPGSFRVLEANQAFCDLLGYESGEVRSLSIYNIVGHARDDIDQFMEHWGSEGRIQGADRVWRRKDGSEI